MAKDRGKLPSKSSRSEVDAFLERVARTPAIKPAGAKGRLIFAMDATASRQPSWDRATHIQAEMFEETKALGGLSIQLVYYRGFRELDASPWLDNADALVRRMAGVFCLGGQTQLDRVLSHAIGESKREKVDALVFVGDCFEEEIDRVCHTAGQLGIQGVPAFIFHEGGEPGAANAFKQIAKLTRGAYCSFDGTSARQLRDLLSAVAVYAAGGRRALEDFGRRKGGAVPRIAPQLR